MFLNGIYCFVCICVCVHAYMRTHLCTVTCGIVNAGPQIWWQMPLSAKPCLPRNLTCFPFSFPTGTQTLLREGRTSPSLLPSNCLATDSSFAGGTLQLSSAVRWNGLRTLASWDAKVDSPGSHDALRSEGWPVGGCHFGSLDLLLSQGCAPVAHIPVP